MGHTQPTGLPGVFETLSRPHIPDIATAVRMFAERKYATGGPFHPDTPGPWRETPAVRSAASRHDQRFLDLFTLEATYIDDTFGHRRHLRQTPQPRRWRDVPTVAESVSYRLSVLRRSAYRC
ncbi:hypothetical protein FDG2_2860 [Candidatus Protofrankia californiensis]|uniref:Uncharacterized protein n=1 Tax=Candidatus Protofrankia californiensis TaxID=1839754 RepID=A0A1C3NYJ2_9ACTN|nr:hypothetical protein FDG2_2860 [Candidatus Protofrankia californiensis]